MYNLKTLIDGAFDESADTFTKICNRYDGVAATPENVSSLKQELRTYLDEYNYAADYFGGDAHTLDLSGKATQAAINHFLNNIVYGSVCITDNGVLYFRMGNWPTHDENIQKAPAPSR